MTQKEHSHTPQKKPRNGVIVLLILVIVIAALASLYYFTKVTPGPEIITNVIDLRTEQNTLTKSQLVSRTEDLVLSAKSRVVESEWRVLAECMAAGCEDTDYFNFIQTVVNEVSVPNGDLITNVIATYKYWGSDQVVLFSRAMTEVNEGIDALYSRTLSENWKKVVECDSKCENENDLYFELVKGIVELE